MFDYDNVVQFSVRIVEMWINVVFDFVVYGKYGFVENCCDERYVFIIICIGFCVCFDGIDICVCIVFDVVDDIVFGDILIRVYLCIIVKVVVFIVFFFCVEDKFIRRDFQFLVFFDYLDEFVVIFGIVNYYIFQEVFVILGEDVFFINVLEGVFVG